MHEPAFTVRFGTTDLRAQRAGDLGVVVLGEVGRPPDLPSPYLDGVLGEPGAREAFFAWVDREGLVVCKGLEIDPHPYREVGGRYCKGRMSQSEYFHHDGCSSPTKPRIVEIRCPTQRTIRQMRTSVARFPQIVATMVLTLPEALLRSPELRRWRDALRAGEPLDADWDAVQGGVNRCIRQISSDAGTAWFREVDEAAGSYVEPWSFGESRFMANDNPVQTVQHRRALQPPWRPGVPNGGLLKRWPAEELSRPWSALVAPAEGERCARGEAR
jgi:hypothetical protein